MPPVQGKKLYKRYGRYNTHKHRWTAQRPQMGKNAMWRMLSPKQRDNQRGRWITRRRVQKEVATEVIKGYLQHLEEDSMTL